MSYSVGSGYTPGPEFIPRTGIIGRWLDLTAPHVPAGTLPIEARERLRKAELTSYSILAVFIFLFMLVSNSLDDPATGRAVGSAAVGLIITAICNRFGRTLTAAYFISSLMMFLIAGAIVGRPGLELISLPAYDLFILPIFLTSLIADRRAPWIFSFLAIAFIIGDFTLQQHTLVTVNNQPPGVGVATNFDAIRYETAIFNTWGMVNRHVALALFAAFFGWLGARSVDAAIQRADRAEEMAALEHAVADQRRQLEIGIQQILETHVRVANGDYTARAPLNHDNILWQIAVSLNNLLQRLQKAGQADHQLRRTDEELRRLAAAIDDAQAGRRPIWPAPTGTSADLIIERITNRNRQPAPQGMLGTGQLGTGQLAGFPPQPGMQPLMSRMPSVPQLPQMPQMPQQMFQPQPQPQAQQMQQMPPMTAPLPTPTPGFGQSAPASNPVRMPASAPHPQPADPAQTAPENPWFAPPEPPSW